MNKLKFSELKLSPEIQKGVLDMGFEEATHIQSEAIPMMMKGLDLTGQAQTGTGKTAAFGIPLLEKMDAKSKDIQALVMCPTRELAIQVAEEIRKLGKYVKGINVLAVYGGQPIDRQMRALRAGAQIVIGTPGRLMDHMERKTIKLDTVKTVVLDEADEMLNRGFIEDIEFILKHAPADRQIVLFSATMPKPILDITKRYQKDPKFIKITHEILTAPNIDQTYFELKHGMKTEALARILDMHDFKSVLIFCNTKKKVDELVEQLRSRGYLAECIHGDKMQSQRDRVMEKFRAGKIEILIATDVAARGIDVENIDVVVNYDVPSDEEYYVHRIGRTGRAGRAGKAFTFVYGDEMYKLREIQRYAKIKIKPGVVPSVMDVEELKTNQFMEMIRQAVAEGKFDSYERLVEKLMNEGISSVDIAAALMKKMMKNQEEAPAKTKEDDLNAAARIKREGTGDMVKLFINAGKSHNVGVRDILKAITDATGIRGELIGRIDLFDQYSFFQIDSSRAEEVMEKMKGKRIRSVRAFVDKAKK
jgi:ATP-dependent RNA helicase DeaD